MRRRNIRLLALVAVLVASGLRASDLKTEIRRGVELHDSGDFAGAIQAFKSVLAVDPQNAEALYELTNSYFASGDFESCIATAKAGLRQTSGLEVGFHTAAGNCYSSTGKTERALESFRSGLDIAPRNASLNFNIAVTLFHSQDWAGAIDHLETAIDAKPSYSSPYYLLGETHRQKGARVKSLFYLARFFTLEPSSSRAVHAAKTVLDLLASGIEVKSEADIEVTVPTLEEGDPMSPLEMSLPIAGLSVHTDEVAALPSKAHRSVAALTTFFQIVLEMSGPDEVGLRSVVAWKQAIAPILEVHEREGSEALAFMMAMSANVDGAREWVEANPQKIEDLRGILAE